MTYLLLEQELKSASQTQEVTVLKVSADWCGPCKKYAPIYEKVAAELESIQFFAFDITELEPSILSTYNIKSVPATVVFRDYGKTHEVYTGALTEEKLRSILA